MPITFPWERILTGWSITSLEVDNAVATATQAGVSGKYQAIRTAEASYSNRNNSGLLTVTIGATVVARKYIHGTGAIDFGIEGIPGATGEGVTATLAASGTPGVTGAVMMTGVTLDANP